MSDQQPHTAIEATGRVATDVVSGLKNQPMMLALVVLNVIGIAAAVWFLRELAADSRATKGELLQLVNYCIRAHTDSTPEIPGR